MLCQWQYITLYIYCLVYKIVLKTSVLKVFIREKAVLTRLTFLFTMAMEVQNNERIKDRIIGRSTKLSDG